MPCSAFGSRKNEPTRYGTCRRIYTGIAIPAFLFEQAARFEPETAKEQIVIGMFVIKTEGMLVLPIAVSINPRHCVKQACLGGFAILIERYRSGVQPDLTAGMGKEQ